MKKTLTATTVTLSLLLPAITLPGCAIAGADSTGTLHVESGEIVDLNVGVNFLLFIRATDLRVPWSVNPPTEGVSIDPSTGIMIIRADVPNGTEFNVRGGVVSVDIYVTNPAELPLVGTWREVGQIDCETGEEITPYAPIAELTFTASGSYFIARNPEEFEYDQTGTYETMPVSPYLRLHYLPGRVLEYDTDRLGEYFVNGRGHLILQDISLGVPIPDGGSSGDLPEPVCGHRFVRVEDDS